MKCDICKAAEATVHLTQIDNGALQKIDLCPDCAKAKGVSDSPTGFSIADLLMGMGAGAGKAGAPAAPAGELQCAGCGMKQADFKKSGRLGCAECYDTFADGLAPLLKGMHKGEQHVGKRPGAGKARRGSAPSARAAEENPLAALKRELEKAIQQENFELAAQLRDRIRKIEQA